ncbi:hypothetical protein PbJCM13498_37670 [Prolixibacter bellariivorans]|uniref:Uncharacterized protein n=1 Tax=Prolixibacter bellariivorans TaxID=314319 RepID=A0A5M4B459_9BACT|nr:hypothetical protein [Prolixibacter bellariivorans]GET34904.1 hypothetical protein PbJCM13498_37670 [Prolixibacter bellariivorans]
MNKVYFLLATMLFVLGIVKVTEAQNEKKAQVTFFYPIGSSGLNSTNYNYHFSFNTIYGITGGVNGFELGSVGNIARGNVKGLQIAGVFNIATPGSLAGTIRAAADSSETANGLQLAGVSNMVKGNQKGWQIAGVCNTTTGNSSGVVLSGVSNITRKDVNGAMVSGVFNSSRAIKGVQLSTINIATKSVTGAQIGVVNIAPRGKGFQLGVVNIGQTASDSIIPLGLLNIFKDGYYAFELSTDEKLFSQISYKMGVEKLYTIFQFGVSFRNNTQFYSAGSGLGSIFDITPKNKINLELITTQFFENDFKYIPDFLNQANLDYQYNLTKHIALKIGPTFNCYIEKNNKKTNDAIRIPYSIIEAKGRYHTTSLWIGANAGVVIKL